MKLRTEHLNVYYKRKQVLKDVSIEIPRHQITAIIGQSGCGKSTLLKSLNRICEEEEGTIQGTIYLDQTDIHSIHTEDLRRKIGMVFQQPIVFPCSVEDNLRYVLQYHFSMSKPECEAKIKEYLTVTRLYEELKDSMKRSALKLSGGQQQRLAIARSLCVQPEVILLDEPCSALDMKNTIAIEKMLVELKQEYTIVIVTHNLPQAHRIADQILFMDQGRVIEKQAAAAFFQSPKTALAKEYIQYME